MLSIRYKSCGILALRFSETTSLNLRAAEQAANVLRLLLAVVSVSDDYLGTFGWRIGRTVFFFADRQSFDEYFCRESVCFRLRHSLRVFADAWPISLRCGLVRRIVRFLRYLKCQGIERASLLPKLTSLLRRGFGNTSDVLPFATLFVTTLQDYLVRVCRLLVHTDLPEILLWSALAMRYQA